MIAPENSRPAAGPPVVRFAPSPTGDIHVGNARTALYNWLFAKKSGGSFILRFDDTDRERSRAEFAQGIERDLAWLGMEPDRIEHQSDRLAAYEEAAAGMKAAGRLYVCYETPEELDRQRARLRARGRPPVYDRRALKLSPEDRAGLEAEGRRPHWRFLLPNFDDDPFVPRRTDIAWDDLFRGAQSVDLASISDPVLVRADGTFLYTLTSVVDDMAMAVTHVIRGDDHVTNTGVQLAIFAASGGSAPVFGHHNLLQSESGEGLSKRDRSFSVAQLREGGFEPLAVASAATLIGTSEPVRAVRDLAELAEIFSPAIVNKAATRFSFDDLRHLNGRVLDTLPYEAVAARLKTIGADGGVAFWEAVRSNLEFLHDARRWWRILNEPITPIIEDADRDFIGKAATLLPDEPWDGNTWRQWTEALKAETGRKGSELYRPLRLALTGVSSGPELARLLPLLGRRASRVRLSGHRPSA